MISKVEDSSWGTSVVPVLKEAGGIRICRDYKVTINKYVEDFKKTYFKD